MNNKKLIFLSLLCVGSQLNAETNQSTNDLQTTFELSQGYRHEKLDVKINRGQGAVSYKQNRQYKNVDVYTTRLGMTLRKNDYFLKGIAGYGSIRDGKLRRSSNYKEGMYNYSFKESSNITGDYTADFAIKFGRDFSFENGWKIAPTLGYGVYFQNFHTNRGKAHYHNNQNEHERLRTTKEHYKATWYSPQLGLNVRKAITSTLTASLDYAFLFPLSYQATGHHNSHAKKRTHYEQQNKASKSFGNIATVGLEWNFAKNWSLKPEFEFMKFYSKGGDSSHRYRFKGATRTATEYRLVLGYSF